MRRPTRSTRPISPDADKQPQSEERTTRSRKSSQDLIVMELPRVGRIHRRRGSGKSPDAERDRDNKDAKTLAVSSRGLVPSDTGTKREKRSSVSDENLAGTSGKKRRKSGRLADAAEEKEKLEKQEKGVHGKQEKETKERKEKLERGNETKLERERKEMHEKDKKERQEKEKREKEKHGKDKQTHDKDSKKGDDGEISIKETSGVRRRRTRSGRYVSEENGHEIKDHEESADKGLSEKILVQNSDKQNSSSKKDEQPSKTSSNVDEIEQEQQSTKAKSPPKSHDTVKKCDTSKVEVQDQKDLILSELTVKITGKQSSKASMSPPLRMSPRRARHSSGQHPKIEQCVLSDKEVADEDKNQNSQTVVIQKKSINESSSHLEELKEIQSPSRKAANQETKSEPSSKRKKSSSCCRDLSQDFGESNESQKSPSRSTRVKKEVASSRMDETTSSEASDVSTNLAKSPQSRRNSSPTKSQRESGPQSPRRGLRSSKVLESELTTDVDVCVETAVAQENKLDVVTMETEVTSTAASTAADISEPNLAESMEVGEVKNTELETEQEAETNDVVVLQEQKEEENDVTEISDDVAVKIKEWKLQEENSVGFQGEEWHADEVDEGEPFYFESDHMALKGNKDYRMLLRTITTLEAQRKQAIKDLDKLVAAQRDALRNPLRFVDKLQKKDVLGLPTTQRIVLLPDIPWGRYLGQADSTELIQGLSHHTRASIKQKQMDSHTSAGNGAGTSGLSSDQTTGPDNSNDPDDKDSNVIRGRVWDASKPETFNRLWTVGEQKRLEDLLMKYPMEEVEARRWEKIARELGNRTRFQVASRVQKYFIKLSKAGLPVPGRLPNMTTYTNKKPQRRFVNPYSKMLHAPSTFLQSIRPPVLMNEDEDMCYDMDCDDDDDDADSIMDEDDIPAELKDTDEYRELLRLKKLRNITLKQQTDVRHIGFSCDSCGVSPISGVRWHCMDCSQQVSTDLCQNCVNDDFKSDIHTTNHHMEPVYPSQGSNYVDSDYTSFSGTTGDYNYLDPNYSPAVL